ncbi:MAG TPA: hypothetical protein VGV15_01780 [Terriglobales bacterium]|nr:hypothetical protein [Terriglobales bacterium]
MNAEVPRPSLALASDRRVLISDLFHALNQPLTTLRCSLELTLHQPAREAEQYREALNHALEHAEQIARLASGIHELVEVDQSGAESEVLQLDSYLQHTVMDLLPVAEAAGVRVSLRRSSCCYVLFERQRLRSALFHLLEYVLGSSSSGSVVNIEALEQDGDAVIALGSSSNTALSAVQSLDGGDREFRERELARRLRLALARGIFESAGGRFHAETNAETFFLEVRLPMASLPA